MRKHAGRPFVAAALALLWSRAALAGDIGSPPLPAPPAPPAEVQPTSRPGTLHIDSDEPAHVSVGGGDFGSAPVDVRSLPPGIVTVVLRYKDGVTVSRDVLVRAGETTPVLFEARANLSGAHGLAPASSGDFVLFRPGATPGGGPGAIRFGIGVEPVLWYIAAYSTTEVGARAVGRMNVDLSRRVSLRADLLLGALHGSLTYPGEAIGRFATSGASVGETALVASTRFDVQFNATPHYALSLGVDIGLIDFVDTAFLARFNTANASTLSYAPGTFTQVVSLVGLHASPVTVRFGRSNEFELAAREGVIAFHGNNGGAAFEQTVGFTYLFGPGGP